MGRSRKGGAGIGGELGKNKKGTPLYSREDIREQYCINDKELQVLDKSQRKSLLGCFSNQGQVKVLKNYVFPYNYYFFIDFLVILFCLIALLCNRS